jgi:hypothetical protein
MGTGDDRDVDDVDDAQPHPATDAAQRHGEESSLTCDYNGVQFVRKLSLNYFRGKLVTEPSGVGSGERPAAVGVTPGVSEVSILQAGMLDVRAFF